MDYEPPDQQGNTLLEIIWTAYSNHHRYPIIDANC